MKHKHFNQKGFGHLLLGLLVLVIVLAGAFAFIQVKNANGAHQSTPLGQAKGLADCNGKQGVLTYSPVATKDLSTIIPLGNLAPPGHVIPTMHMYYNYHVSDDGNLPAKTNLYVPADMTVTKITLFDNNSFEKPFNSYRIDFAVCKQVYGYYIHVVTLNSKLAAAFHKPYDDVETDNVGLSKPDHTYSKNVNVKLTAGDIIGTGGGATGLPDGVDFSLSDIRFNGTHINQGRWNDSEDHIVCSLDYYPAALSTELYNHLGGYDYIPRNPGNPACGIVYQDKANTAQGVWFGSEVSQGEVWNVDAQLTLGTYNLDHSYDVLSIGNDGKKYGVEPGLYGFKPVETGNVNLDFGSTKPGGSYCYEAANMNDINRPRINAVLIKLTGSTSLRIGSLNTATCGDGPWQFSQYHDYNR